MRVVLFVSCIMGLSLASHLISEYKFLETECVNQLFLDSSFTSYSSVTQIGPLVYTGPCTSTSNGVSSLASSRSSVPSSWSHKVSSAWTTELWIQVNKTALTLTQLQPLTLLEFGSTRQSSFPPLRIGLGKSTLSTSLLQLVVSICNAGLTQQTFLFAYPRPQVSGCDYFLIYM